MRILYQLTSPMDKTVGPQEVARRQKVLQSYAAAGTEVAVEPTGKGPAAIESAHDAGLVVPELIRLAPAAERRAFSAIVIGCYSDPGLDALREMLTIPVIGPGAASLHLAAQLGTRLSVLTPAGRGFGRVAARLRALALGELLVSVRGIGLSVMDLAQQKPGALVSAVPRPRLLETETASHQCSGTQSVPMIAFALLFVRTQPMNFFTLPTGAPRVTK